MFFTRKMLVKVAFFYENRKEIIKNKTYTTVAFRMF